MAEVELPMLVQLTEKVLTSQIKDAIIRYCPTMDLVAIVTTDEQVEIYRLNGQKVLDVPAMRSCKTVDVAWKPNGSLLAVAYSDNSISLIATQGGKSVYQIQYPVSPETSINALSWTITFTDVDAVVQRLKSSQKDTKIDDVIHRGFLGEISATKLDLPGDLAALSTENILPKLSVLPPGGKAGDVFTSRGSIDSLFHSKDPKANSSDVLLVAFADGSACLSVHDFFEVGRFESRQIATDLSKPVVLKASNHPYRPVLTLLLADPKKAGSRSLDLVALDLRLLSDNGKQFSQLATKATQMQNVVRYLKECQIQICTEFKTSQTLPHRFIANVEEDLQKDEQTDFITATYHLVTTGDCSPVMKEWLVDQLAERGQKRWEKASTSGYETIRRLIHENMLPALDRITILCNRLRGLSLYQETALALGLETTEIDHVLDSVQCLQLLGHTALISADSELRQSFAFCAWLRQEIDTQASDSTNPHEPDKEPNFDFADILDYIRGSLRNSTLYELLDVKQEEDKRETTPLPPLTYDLYDAFKTALGRIRSGVRPASRLPGLEVLIDRLQDQCSLIFARIATAQQEKVRFGETISLGECDVDLCDMRIHLPEGNSRFVTFVTAVADDRKSVRVTSLVFSVQRGISSLSGRSGAILKVYSSSRVLDTKFVDDHSILVLVEHDAGHVLYSLRYKAEEDQDEDEDADISFLNSDQSDQEAAAVLLDLQTADPRLRRHFFAASSVPPFRPHKLEVNGRKGRRVVCVVAEDMLQYRIFDIDSPEGGEVDYTEEALDGDALMT